MKWEMAPVKNVAVQVRGVSYKPTDVSEVSATGFTPILRANNITENGLNTEDLVFVRSIRISEKQMLKPGDILIAASSGSKSVVGKAISIKHNIYAAFGAFCKVIRPNSEQVSPRYLGYYFQSPGYRRIISELSAGANINNIRNEDVDELAVPLPPLHIQEQIADRLDKADALGRKDQELFQKYVELAQAVFYDMFGDPVKNEKGWPKTTFDKLIKIETKSLKPAETAGKHYVGLENIEKNTGVISISKEIDLKSNKFLFDNRCILYGKLRPYLRKVATPDFNGVCSTDIFPIRCVTLNKEFATTILRSQHFTDYATSSSVGANLPRVNKEVILSYETICPPRELQDSYARKVGFIFRQRLSVRHALNLTDSIRSVLLANYFS
jgi:type I restriction enzyme S subunit